MPKTIETNNTATATATSTSKTVTTDSKSNKRSDSKYSVLAYTELTQETAKTLELYNRNKPLPPNLINESKAVFPSKAQFHAFPKDYQRLVFWGIRELNKSESILEKIAPYNILVNQYNSLVRKFNSLLTEDERADGSTEKKILKLMDLEVGLKVTVEKIKEDTEILKRKISELEREISIMERASNLIDGVFGASTMSDEEVLRQLMQGRAQIVASVENSSDATNNSYPSP